MNNLKIAKELNENGHTLYDLSWITRPLQSGETIESILWGHYERLIIAAHLLTIESQEEFKLRKISMVAVIVVSDKTTYQFLSFYCFIEARATKIIATMRQCEIVVRDTNHIHHFHVNGQCSCQSYF